MKLTWTLMLVLALPMYSQRPEMSAEATAEKQIRDSLGTWVQAANRGDWNEALKVWAPDLIGWYPGTPDVTYAKEVENAARAAAPRTKYELEIKEVMVSGSIAVVRDLWTFSTKLESGELVVDKVKSFEVWQRQPDGSWKISRWISAPEPKP